MTSRELAQSLRKLADRLDAYEEFRWKDWSHDPKATRVTVYLGFDEEDTDPFVHMVRALGITKIPTEVGIFNYSVKGQIERVEWDVNISAKAVGRMVTRAVKTDVYELYPGILASLKGEPQPKQDICLDELGHQEQ